MASQRGFRRMGERKLGTCNCGFRPTGTSSAAHLHGIGWSLLRKHVHRAVSRTGSI